MDIVWLSYPPYGHDTEEAIKKKKLQYISFWSIEFLLSKLHPDQKASEEESKNRMAVD